MDVSCAVEGLGVDAGAGEGEVVEAGFGFRVREDLGGKKKGVRRRFGCSWWGYWGCGWGEAAARRVLLPEPRPLDVCGRCCGFL